MTFRISAGLFTLHNSDRSRKSWAFTLCDSLHQEAAPAALPVILNCNTERSDHSMQYLHIKLALHFASSSKCLTTAPFQFLILQQPPCLLSLAVALSTSQQPDRISRRVDIQFCEDDSVWGVVARAFEVLTLSRRAD